MPDARIIWRAAVDPGALRVALIPTAADDPDGISIAWLEPLLMIAGDALSGEHAVFSDGWRRIRLDVASGSLSAGDRVVPHYLLHGLVSADAQILPLRRFLYLCRTGRFASALFPRVSRIDRLLLVLRVHDALGAGATQREIAAELFGAERVREDWRGATESLRSRVRRLARDARRMAAGGYRLLLRQEARPSSAPADRG